MKSGPICFSPSGAPARLDLLRLCRHSSTRWSKSPIAKPSGLQWIPGVADVCGLGVQRSVFVRWSEVRGPCPWCQLYQAKQHGSNNKYRFVDVLLVDMSSFFFRLRQVFGQVLLVVVAVGLGSDVASPQHCRTIERPSPAATNTCANDRQRYFMCAGLVFLLS